MNSSTPYDKHSSQFGLFLNETDPFPDFMSPNPPQRAIASLGNQPAIFNDLSLLNHSATQDIHGLKEFSHEYHINP